MNKNAIAMKKLLYSLFAVFLAIGAYAQPNPDDLFISGYVTDESTGQALGGVQVCVLSDSSNINFYFYECATTNSNGYYSITVPNGSVTGPNINYYVYTWDCNNAVVDTTVANMQGSVDAIPVDFSICHNNQTCQADFLYTYGFSGGVFFTYTGSPNTPSSFYWDFGDGSTSTLQDPSHYYNSQGPWLVQLTITTSSGCTSTVMDTIWGSGNNLCDASFTYNTTPAGVVGFSYNGTNLNSQTYQWSFGDGSASNLPNPTHTYTGSGPYVVCVTISDSVNNCTSTYCDTVVLNNTSFCQADYVISVDSSTSGIYVLTLTDQSVGNVVSYDWWVDGASYSSQNVVHTYQGQGIIGVCLTIETADSCTSYLCDTVYLGTGNGNNCQANFQYIIDSVPSGGNLVSFYGSSGVNGAFYYWDFGDGQTSYSQNPDHIYSSNGVYLVCLTVTDSINQCSSTYCDSVSLGGNGNVNCQANFQAIQDSVNVFGNVVYFNDLSSGSPSYWSWDFGDNTTSNQQNPTHTYSNPGTYTVCLTIANLGSNCFDTYCAAVVIDTVGSGNNCQANYTYSTNPGGGITFFGSAGTNSAQYLWSFGDGSSGSGQTVTHNFNAPGTYTVCLTVYGPSGCSDTYCGQVSYGTNTSGYCISGTVSAGTPNYPADYGLVYLITYDSQTNLLTAVDTTTLDSAGFYVFCDIPAGEYLIKAALTPNSIYYSNFLPTYYGNSLFWDYAQSVQVGPNLTFPYAPITLIAGNNPGGPGFIGGDVTQGANKTSGPGDPVESVLVMLLDINDDPIAYTYTNAQGEFQFANVAYGTYKVYAEVTGLPTYPAIVTVDANNVSFSNIHIYHNTNEITTGVIELDNNKVVRISEIYPNPTNGDAFINFELMEAAEVTINVFSATGQLVSSETVQLGVNANQVEIDTDNLNRGLYMVKFTEINGQFSFNKQMVITK